MSPPALEREDLSGSESYRKDSRFTNETRADQNEATRRRTLGSTAGSRAIRGKVYRHSLGDTCTMVSSPNRAGGVRAIQKGQ